MKIYLRSSSQEKSVIDKIKSAIKDAGHKVGTTLSECDIFIVEASAPTAQLGFEISSATEKGIPTVILYRDEDTAPRVSVNLKTQPIIRAYKIDQLEEQIKNILHEILNTISGQLTIDLTPPISDFLDWISTSEKVSRPDFIKDLIDRARKKNTKYRDYLKKKD